MQYLSSIKFAQVYIFKYIIKYIISIFLKDVKVYYFFSRGGNYIPLSGHDHNWLHMQMSSLSQLQYLVLSQTCKPLTAQLIVRPLAKILTGVHKGHLIDIRLFFC